MSAPAKIVVAFDKFKGSLSALNACEIVGRELRAAFPTARVVLQPMADGGDGTAAALQAALGGDWITKVVSGPLPTMRCVAKYLWVPHEQLACIEMAQASGLTLLPLERRNPLLTTSFGTGELIADATGRGVRRIWLGVGGSATVDGGIGAAAALGWQFRDEHGRPVSPVGGALQRIRTLQAPRRTLPEITVLCDVDNPLCGEHGAARVFGPQKGATPAMVEQLDDGLRHLATLVKTQLGKDILELPGGGAAGGLAAGAVAFFGARLVSGVETLMRVGRLAEQIAVADWVITGEGRLDAQSLRGKVVSGVASVARRAGAKVAVLAGSVALSETEWREAGVAVVVPIQPPGMSTAEAMARAQELLAVGARRLAQTMSQATQ